MSFPSTAARLAFFDLPEDAPAPNPILARVDAAVAGPPSDRGPARFHTLHGSIPIGRDTELRITSQGAREGGRPPRVVIRIWGQRRNGVWWPLKREPGVTIDADRAEEFGRAVAAAVAAMVSEAKS